ncbi:LuxR family transcriptional regulator [Cryobacterium roopkundense]|uniref:DNA-binding NarL/FixJ family response regulator n=1 Tax=Cryobacterium roopkundense TaxID=1001240 RepID=A0A099J2S1_9MICO|nr:response regulator transcription factor [Cryobacterium roopkundense]KGJ72699.1 LuxR family transcriptional regulator [Cryobacterium roopkundense]MBB5643035.1 DNA-binding NarL/FixJ family response regulator [Cryobacterium roopkundense]
MSDQTRSSNIRVLLVDDQALVRAGFRIILQSEPGIVVVGEAADGAGALDLARSLHPDVICMDVQMPGVDGLAATRSIVEDPSVHSAVLILTTFDREDYLFAALQNGASGFLLKNSTPEALIRAVQVLARGDALLAPDVTRRVIERCVSPRDAPTVTRTSEVSGLPDLTERESEVFALLAQGLANSEIAGQLFLGEATVKSHVSKVLMKLQLRDRVQAVVFAYEHGIIVPGVTLND